jgi:ribokinase
VGALVYGDINVDLLARLPAPLVARGDNLFPAFELALGGVGANAAVSLARLGGTARLAGCVGRDWLGDFALEALTRCGVNASAVRRADGVTGLVVIPVDPGGQRTILGGRGVNTQPPAVGVAECLRDVRAVLVFGYALLAEATRAYAFDLIARARRAGLVVALDAGPGPSRDARREILELAPQLDALFVSLDEAEALTDRRGADALEAIANCGAREILLKRGAAGCQFLSAGTGSRWWMVAPLPVDAVDTTGAGDAFAAGFLHAKLRGWTTADAALLANAMGAAATTRLGAGTAMPGLADAIRVLEADAGDATSARILRLLRAEPTSARVG